jgi:hypothetical protein
MHPHGVILFHPYVAWYSGALVICGLLLTFELFAGVLSSIVHLSHDFNHDIAHDASHEVTNVAAFLSWAGASRVPFVVFTFCFLYSVGLSGVVLQVLAHALIGKLFLPLYVLTPALIAAIGVTKFFCYVIGALLPEDHTEALEPRDFVGRVALVSVGPITSFTSGVVSFVDQYNVLHNERAIAIDGVFTQEKPVQIVGIDGDGGFFIDHVPPLESTK